MILRENTLILRILYHVYARNIAIKESEASFCKLSKYIYFLYFHHLRVLNQVAHTVGPLLAVCVNTWQMVRY